MLVEGDRMAEVPMAQHEHSWNGGTSSSDEVRARNFNGAAGPDVGHRLHANVHICKHARCAANDPHYAVKAATPPKKFLVAKKHAYGGLEKKGDRKSTSADQDGSSALHSLTNSILQPKDGKTKSNGSRPNSEPERGLKCPANSALQSIRRKDRSTSPSKVGERKGKPASSIISSGRLYSGSSGRSLISESVSTPKDRHVKSQLRNGNSAPIPTTDRVSSPESSVTFTSSSRVMISSPAASVGSNDGIEISSLQETVMILEGEIFGQSVKSTTSIASSLQSPVSESLSSILMQSSPSEEVSSDTPGTPSVASRRTLPESPTPSINSNPSGPSLSCEYTTPGASSLPTPNGDSSSSFLRKSVADVGTNFDSPYAPSVAPSETLLESPTPTVTTNKSRPSPSSLSTTPEKSSLTIGSSSSSSTKLAGRFVNNLMEKAKASALSASAKKHPNSKVTASLVDSTIVPPTAATRIAKKFISDLQTSSSARRVAASSKGVRAIELRGGKAQTFSTSTVTSWNATTTTVENTLSVSDDNNPVVTFDSELSGPELSATSLNHADTEGTLASAVKAAAIEPASEDRGPDLKLLKNVKGTVLDDAQGDRETVSLKHVEGAERRLSDEWMIHHPLNHSEAPERRLSDEWLPHLPLNHASDEAATEFTDDDREPGLKLRKTVKGSAIDDVEAESETVALKHGDVAERRLSEEWMTNHALEGVVKKISDKDHRVKVLVHAFESLATLSDSEILLNEDNSLKTQLDSEALSGAPIAA